MTSNPVCSSVTPEATWTPLHGEILRANGLLLLEAWLHSEAEHYAGLPSDERAPYIDTRLDRITDWGLVGFFDRPAGGNAPTTAPGNGTVALMAMVGQWIDRADPEVQPQLRQFVGHVQQRVLWRSLQGLWQ